MWLANASQRWCSWRKFNSACEFLKFTIVWNFNYQTWGLYQQRKKWGLQAMPRKNPIAKSWEIQDLIPNFPIIDKLMSAHVCCVSPALLLLPGFHAMAHPWLPWLRSCVPHMDKGIIEGGVDVSNASIAATISTRSANIETCPMLTLLCRQTSLQNPRRFIIGKFSELGEFQLITVFDYQRVLTNISH
jgi:hypothetical protein